MGWTYREIDEITWSELTDLLNYWEEFPPVNVLLRGMANGMGARLPESRRAAASTQSSLPSPKHVQSGEELLGILQGSGLPFGVIHGR